MNKKQIENLRQLIEMQKMVLKSYASSITEKNARVKFEKVINDKYIEAYLDRLEGEENNE